jgi:hypothetical protein
MTTTATVEAPKQREMPTDKVDPVDLALWGIQLVKEKQEGNPYARVVGDAILVRQQMTELTVIEAMTEAYLVLAPALAAVAATTDTKADIDQAVALLGTNFAFGFEMDTPREAFRLAGGAE